MKIFKTFNIKSIALALSAVSVVTLISCGDEDATPPKEIACFYSHDNATGALVRWTAFKTTAKVPVGGQFNQVNVSTEGKSTKVVDVLRTIKFNIPTASTYTENEERDAKIIEAFFGSMDATDLIIGHVKNAEGDNQSGTCVFYLNLNNIERETAFRYTVLEDGLIQLNGKIDLHDFKGENAITALNTVCKELHQGEDGISKTWSEVEIAIETKMNKKCH